MDFIIWVFTNIGMGFVNLFYVILHPSAWLDWSDKTALGHFIYYGASKEFFFVIFDIFVVISVVGAFYRKFLWAIVRGFEAFANTVGRFFAWASLFMVMQQIMIVFLQRIFKVAEISISPFGYAFTRDLSWYGEELKFYNAMIVCLAASYTFVQGGHVRVDLFYAGMRHRAKKVVDMFGSLFFVIPFMTIIWMFGWFFMWRHLVTPKVNVTKTLSQMDRLSPHLKWNVETIGFSPNGFDGYFLFKILLISFAGMMFIQGLTFFWRSMLEFIEGEASARKYLQLDELNDETAEAAAAAH
ncbi:C4-dicarboxylate ABC transporter permease [Rhodobacterales bacterium 52_120_T64]|nr:C4-dicarboxylate ABC transporter permease [Rhodobacterales bacterium 52_120_T64]